MKTGERTKADREGRPNAEISKVVPTPTLFTHILRGCNKADRASLNLAITTITMVDLLCVQPCVGVITRCILVLF